MKKLQLELEDEAYEALMEDASRWDSLDLWFRHVLEVHRHQMKLADEGTAVKLVFLDNTIREANYEFPPPANGIREIKVVPPGSDKKTALFFAGVGVLLTLALGLAFAVAVGGL